MKKNAVLGVSINFDENRLKNLILSFRQVNIRDDLILFVDPKEITKLQSHFHRYNVMLKSFCFYDIAETTVHNSRYIKCLEFLHDHIEYENILLCDTKDVIFQKDPFESLAKDSLFFFQEDSGIRIADEMAYNGGWIYSAYGEEILHNIFPYNIICSGTILGSREKILVLLDTVKSEFLKIRSTRPDTYRSMILDQAVVNYLARFNKEIIDISQIKVNGDIVATIGISASEDPQRRDEILISGHHMLVNGFDPSIIHQYDRNPILKNLYDSKYVL